MSKKQDGERKLSAPWRLLGFSGCLALGLVVGGGLANWSPPVFGKAELRDGLAPDQQGWQLSLDLSRRRSGSDAQMLAVLDRLTDHALSEQEREMMLKESVLLKASAGFKANASPLSIAVQADSGHVDDSDLMFPGGPLAVLEWTQGDQSVRGNLYQSQQTWGAYSGRLSATLPLSGLTFSGPGFSWQALSQLPTGEALLVIDAELLRLPTAYRSSIESVWQRWEFSPLPMLGRAIGPALIYMRWKGEPLFAMEVREHQAVETAIEKRFPESVIASTIRRVYGTKVRGFDPQGPAWYLRGDTLVATKVGGTERLAQVLEDVLAEPRPRPSLLRQELARLASSESGWHLLIVMSDPENALHWGALLRWPRPDSRTAEGFLVVVPQKSP